MHFFIFRRLFFGRKKEFMNFRFFIFRCKKWQKNRKQTAAFCDQCADVTGGWLQMTGAVRR